MADSSFLTPSPPGGSGSDPSSPPPESASSIFRSSLSAGFTSLASASPSSSAATVPSEVVAGGAAGGGGPPSAVPSTPVRPTVGSSSASSPPPPPPPSPHQPGSPTSVTPCWSNAQGSCFVQFLEQIDHEASTPPRRYYPLIDSILHNELHSTIRNVPYRHERTNTSTVIDGLCVNTISTSAAAFYAQKEMSAGLPPDDPARQKRMDELHLQPYCHVYVATCDGVDHYRAKVRPALQEFVAAMDEEGGRYMILFVPTGGPDNVSTPARGGDGGGGGVSQEVPQRDRELLKKFQIDFPNKTCLLSTLTDAETDYGAGSPGPRSNGTGAGAGAAAAGAGGIDSFTAFTSRSSLFQSEWDAFLRHLGTTIILGFRDRCRAYDEELRTLDKKRRNPSEFDFRHFFLVKESWAFTYEQMRLYREALLHYEELAAFVPERESDGGRGGDGDGDGGNSDDDDGGGDDSGPFSAEAMKKRRVAEEVARYSAAGDTDGFRKVLKRGTSRETAYLSPGGSRRKRVPIKSGGAAKATHPAGGLDDLPVSARHLLQYFFARQSHLLFLLRRPVEVIRKAHEFIVQSYGLRTSDPNCDQAEAESWALSSCWDVKVAAESYFSFSADEVNVGQRRGSDAQSQGHRGSSVERGMVGGVVVVGGAADQEREASRHLSELLEFGRQRLLRLGDLELGGDGGEGGDVDDDADGGAERDGNTVRRAMREWPADTFQEWVPWKDMARPPGASGAGDGDGSGVGASRSGGGLGGIPPSSSGLTSSFLGGALSSADLYEAKYLELSDAIISLYRHAGRRRLASRMMGEQAEIFILHGDYESAARVLLEIVDGCARDGWHRLHFWRLFRLACCQRRTGDTTSYLMTLTKCFNPRFTTSAPRKAAELFQTDLECLVEEDAAANVKLGVSPFLESDIVVDQGGMSKRSRPLNFLRKKLTSSRCHVGEKMTVTCRNTLHMPRPITVDSIRLFIMEFRKYEKIHRSQGDTAINEDNSFRVLSAAGPTTLQPGSNIRQFQWIPMTVGHYVVAGVEIKWGRVRFFHESSLLRKPIQGIEVLPSDSTQKVELNPLFLIPGEKQGIRLAVSSRADIITKGTVELKCSEGLKVLPPGVSDDQGDDVWCERCIVELDPSGPDSTQTVKTLVKSDAIKAGTAIVQTLQATVVTSYHHGLYKELTEDDEPEGPPMETTLEAMVTTLDRPALTFNTSEAFAVSKTSVMVSVSVLCNTPTPFVLKEWEVHFPPPLVLADGGDDANEVLAGHPVALGQEMFFAFACNRVASVRDDDGTQQLDIPDKPTLCIVLSDDEGKTFRQVLPLDLESFYEKMKEEDEYSGVNTATAELKCSSDEGIVGAPVQFTYVVDIGMVSDTKRKSPPRASRKSVSGEDGDDTLQGDPPPLLYSVACDEKYWILGGKMQGIVKRESTGKFAVDFIGIPTNSGMLKHYPEINLYYAHSDTFTSPSITVRCNVPDPFMSLSYKNHMALAAPAFLDVA